MMMMPETMHAEFIYAPGAGGLPTSPNVLQWTLEQWTDLARYACHPA